MKTAEEYKEEAAKHIANREESFQRSDTDGFLSQWASGLNASLALAKAEIAENGGYAQFTVLVNEKDEIVADRSYEGKFGNDSWLVFRELQDDLGRAFIPTGAKSRIQKNLGLKEKKVWAKAFAKITGKGYGLSGTAWVATFPIRDENKKLQVK